MKLQKQHWLFKLSLLSVSVILMSAPIISAALPLMFTDFSNQSKAAIETLLTVPNFGIILALLISPLCIRFFGKKKTVMLGLCIALISGVLPAIISNYSVIFAARFMFGAGIGLFNSLAVSLLAEFYQGDELSTMMGFQSVAGSLGSAALSFLISYLVTLGWHQTFWAYLIIIPVLLLFGLFVTIDEKKATTTSQTVMREKITFNLPVIGLSFLMFFLFVFFMTSVVKLPEYIVSSGIGNTSSVSIISGLSTLVGIPIGLFYGKIHKLLKQTLLPLGLLLASAGFFIISKANNLTTLILGVLLIGIGFGASVPFIYTWTAKLAPKNAINISYTCLIIATNVGVFVSPILLNAFGTLFNNSSAAFSMLVASGGFLAMSIVMGARLFIKEKDQSLLKN